MVTIDDDRMPDMEVYGAGNYLNVKQDEDHIVVGQKQAAKLIEILQKFIDGEKI